MNKAALIEVVARRVGSKAAAERAINAVLEGIRRGLKEDRKVMLSGFGTFVVRERKVRTGQNPRTGERIRVRRTRSVGFRAGRGLRKNL